MPDAYHGIYSIDTWPPEVINESPAPGATDVDLDTRIEFDIIDEHSGVDRDTITVSVAGLDAIINGVFQTPLFSGTITSITYGYHVIIIPRDEFSEYQTVEVIVSASDLKLPPNVLTGHTWSFETGTLQIPEHLIKYNIYYKPAHRINWIKSNPEPLNHNLEGNEWDIVNLSPGVTYHIAIVAGILVDGEWVPFGPQSLVARSRGAGDLEIIENYPYYIVKTLTA